MRTANSKTLVVDACIAAACSEKNPAGDRCRQFLAAVLRICHKVVLTEEITDEWLRHQAPFFRKWLVSMFARKKHRSLPHSPGSQLGSRIDGLDLAEAAREAMLKDLRLLEAAAQMDRIVVSVDESARKLFVRASGTLGELREFVWVNPDKHQKLVEWLEQGAPPIAEFRLASDE